MSKIKNVLRPGWLVAGIVAALLGVLGGMVTASPALAGRGHKWQIAPAPPFTLPASFCGFKVRVTPVVNEEYTKILRTADGSMTFLSNSPATPAPATTGRPSSGWLTCPPPL